MLLSALRAYAGENKDLADFHSSQEIRYRIDLDADGTFVSFAVVSDTERPNRGIEYPIPYVTRTSAVVPLPVDKGDYTLGVPPTKKSDAESETAKTRTAAVHHAYVDLLDQAAKETGLNSFRALHRFASTVDVEGLGLPDDFDPTRFVAVYVNGALPSDDPVAQRWWARRQGGPDSVPGATESDTPAVCGVCGTVAAPVEAMPVSIRGLGRVGGKATMALIPGKSPNQAVFDRHGMVGATGASICLACGNATHQMLNQLIADDRHSTTLGASMYVSWSTEATPDLIGAIVAGESDEAVGDVLRSVLNGRLQPTVDWARFFCVTLGANANRVVVRSWTDVTLADAFTNIRRWFARIRVVDRVGAIGRYPGIFRLLAAVAPPGQGPPLSRLSPGLPDSVLASALTGTALPATLLVHTLGRVRAELGQVSSATAAVLKASVTPIDHPQPEDHMTALNTTSTDPAYLCGRLLAVLDDAARLATTRNNALVDRSYSAASTMPAVTFTRLLRLHRAHIDKLRRDRPGAAVRIDITVAEIVSGLDDFPRTLAVTEQARFALGLYHQQAAGRAAAQQAKEGKALQGPDHDDEIDTDIEENGQ